jgi:hypothetical protein
VRVLVASVYVNAVLWSVPFVRPMSEAIVRAGGPRWLVGSAGVAFAAAVVGWSWHRLRSPFVVVAATAAYGAVVAYLRAVPNEIVHLAEYGVLSLLAWWTLAPIAGRRAPWAALALASLVGLLDEWTQGATAGRYFDWRDVAVNAVAAALPIGLGVRAGLAGQTL